MKPDLQTIETNGIRLRVALAGEGLELCANGDNRVHKRWNALLKGQPERRASI